MKSLIRSLFFGDCENNQKDKAFTKFLIRDGIIDSCGWNSINFLKDDKHYQCFSHKTGEVILISVYDKNSKKHFFCFNNLDYKDNKEKYERLRNSIPKWYAESKKK